MLDQSPIYTSQYSSTVNVDFSSWMSSSKFYSVSSCNVGTKAAEVRPHCGLPKPHVCRFACANGNTAGIALHRLSATEGSYVRC